MIRNNISLLSWSWLSSLPFSQLDSIPFRKFNVSKTSHYRSNRFIRSWYHDNNNGF
ncbi:protein of unknown function [Shewanella benthica]|uniref:Uncharacterized protein n=1 Tax=Shewanella benthica TaxID=43661 RepID=A0A330M5W4_9GAMM|nr:protein of unknown function [Shewanella benthica]